MSPQSGGYPIPIYQQGSNNIHVTQFQKTKRKKRLAIYRMMKNFIKKKFLQHYIEIVTKTKEEYHDPYYKGVLP